MPERVVVHTSSGERLTLGPNDHIATGGEGSVWARRNRVFKVYLDPLKARQARLDEKIALLSSMRHPLVALPTGVLRDTKGEFIGIELPRVQGEPICKLFTNTGRDAAGFDDTGVAAVAQRMREVLEFAHAHKALMVDANELNWLVSRHSPVAIDTDSWALPGFPATAIMASIKDPLLGSGTSGLSFSEGSDWFAWAVVTFQLWTGIHPFKGSHPDYARSALEQRMRDGVSVFDQKVKTPAAARDISCIPPVLREWYRGVFEHQQRDPAPASWSTAHRPHPSPNLRIVSALHASLKQEFLANVGGNVVAAFNSFIIRSSLGSTKPVLSLWDALSKKEVHWLSHDELQSVLDAQALISRNPVGDVYIAVTPEGLSAKLRNSQQQDCRLPLRARRLWQAQGRVFALVEGAANGLVELAIRVVDGRLTLSVDKQWPVNALSSHFFKGVFVQDCLGTPFLGVVEAQGVVQLKCQSLQGWRVMAAAAAQSSTVVVSAVRRSDAQAALMMLSAREGEFQLVSQELVESADLDAVALPSGLLVMRREQSLVAQKGDARKEVTPCGLPAHSRLFGLAGGVGLVAGSDVSKLSLS